MEILIWKMQVLLPVKRCTNGGYSIRLGIWGSWVETQALHATFDLRLPQLQLFPAIDEEICKTH